MQGLSQERLDEAARRIESAKRVDTNGCWIVDIGKTKQGYGRMLVLGEHDLTHRWSYRAFKGEIPESQLVRHTCDVPPCANPDHLIAGTQSDNILDCVARGRYVKNRGGAKLTWQDVNDIRASSETQVSLASRYGVHRMTISDIKTWKTWLPSNAET